MPRFPDERANVEPTLPLGRPRCFGCTPALAIACSTFSISSSSLSAHESQAPAQPPSPPPSFTPSSFPSSSTPHESSHGMTGPLDPGSFFIYTKTQLICHKSSGQAIQLFYGKTSTYHKVLYPPIHMTCKLPMFLYLEAAMTRTREWHPSKKTINLTLESLKCPWSSGGQSLPSVPYQDPSLPPSTQEPSRSAFGFAT